MTSRGAFVAACIVVAGAIAACADGTNESTAAGTRVGDRIAGSSSAFGGGRIDTYALSDGAGGVTHVGVNLPLAVLTAPAPPTATCGAEAGRSVRCCVRAGWRRCAKSRSASVAQRRPSPRPNCTGRPSWR